MTNAATPAGRAVVRALAGPAVRVIAVDSAVDAGVDPLAEPSPAEPPDGVTWVSADVTSPGVAEALDGADAVVHLACPDDLEAALALGAHARRTRAVRSVQAVLTAAAAVGARHAVVVTSAMVFGASPDAPVPLPEDGPLTTAVDDGVVGDLLEVEQVVSRARTTHRGLTVTSLRPAALVGPGVDTLTTRHFEAPRLLAVSGAETLWQFCHVDDLGTAVARVVAHRIDGQLTVGAAGALTAAETERLSGMRRVEVPRGLAFGTAERLHRAGLLSMPASDLHFVVHPWVVSSQRLLEAGWAPAHDNEGCLRELLAQVQRRRATAHRRIERPGAATLGAAGAAVALVGTAAVWRQAKARQRRRRTGRG